MGLDQFQNIVNGGVNGLISKITRPYRLAIMICKELVQSRSNVLLVSRKGLKYPPCGFVAYDRVEPQLKLSEDRMPQTREMHGMRRVPQGEQRQDPVLSQVHGRGQVIPTGISRRYPLQPYSRFVFFIFVRATPDIFRIPPRTRTGQSSSGCSRLRVRRNRPPAGSLYLWRTWTSS